MTENAEMREELLDIIANEGLIDRAKLTPDATLETLNFASYDMVMILMAIEEKYSVYLPVDEGLSEVKTLEQLLDVLVERIVEQQKNPIPRPPDADAIRPAASAAAAVAAAGSTAAAAPEAEAAPPQQETAPAEKPGAESP